MMFYETKTREFGQITFVAPAATDTYSGYLWIEFADGTRRQVCRGGRFLGDTLVASGGTIKAVAKRWVRHRRALINRGGA